jgi:hypothetical protein
MMLAIRTTPFAQGKRKPEGGEGPNQGGAPNLHRADGVKAGDSAIEHDLTTLKRQPRLIQRAHKPG